MKTNEESLISIAAITSPCVFRIGTSDWGCRNRSRMQGVGGRWKVLESTVPKTTFCEFAENIHDDTAFSKLKDITIFIPLAIPLNLRNENTFDLM